jgi:uncharacterized protein YbjT (DUF2867 family)
MTPSLLLIGAASTIGALLLRELTDRRVPTRVLVRDPSRAKPFAAHPLVDVAIGDLADAGAIDAALVGIDRVFVLTPPAPNQVLLQGSLIEAAERTGRAPHVVMVSATGAVPPHVPLRLGRWQAVTEAHLRSSGLPTTILRPQFLMQSFLRAAPTIRVDGLLCGAFGTARLPFVDARDVAVVAAHVLTGDGHAGHAYRLAGPQALSYPEVAETFSAVLDRPIRYVNMPVEAFHEYLVGNGVEDWMAEDLATLAHSFLRAPRETISSTVAAITSRPARTLSQFVRDHASSFTPTGADSVPGGASSPCVPLLWPTAPAVRTEQSSHQQANPSA